MADVKVPASSSAEPNETDWSKCFICQEDTDEKLMYTSVKKESAVLIQLLKIVYSLKN